MDSNREEADRCVALARKAIQGGDLDKARRLLEKANRMYPSPSVAEMLKGLGSRDPGSPGDQRGQGRTGHHSRHSHGASSERPSPRSSHSPSRGRRRNEEEGNRGAQAGRSGHHSASSSSSSESSEGLCKRILRAKNFYDTLGVSKDADDAAIKKAYKKLALQLHPDKCKAPSAEEAFKRIAMAFQTLSDAEKRKNYDAFGENGPPMHSASGDVRYYQYHQGDGFLTPEDLFRMFFGGVPAGVTFQRHGFPTRTGQARPSARGYSANMGGSGGAEGLQTGPVWQRIAGLIQVLPVLLMLFLAIMGNFMPTLFPEEKPVYSFSRTREYSKQRWTGIHNVSFYTNPKSNFDSKFPPDSSILQELEVKIEIIHFTRECGIEERTILQDIAYAKYYQSRSKFKEIQNRSKPNCDKLKWLRDKYPSIYRQTMRN